MTQLQMIRRLEGKWIWTEIWLDAREAETVYSVITHKKVPTHMELKGKPVSRLRTYLSENKKTLNYKVVSTSLKYTAGQHA